MGTETATSSRYYDFLAWTYANKLRLGVALGLIVVVAFVIAFMNWQGNQRELNASEALSLAQLNRNTPAGAEAVRAEAVLKVAREFAGTSAGARAALIGAAQLFADGKYSEAQTEFAKFQPAYPESPLVAQAIIGVAACLDAQRKYPEAAAKYQEAIARFPKDPAIGQAKLALALNHENQNQPAQAQRLYVELTQSTAFNSAGSEAGMRLEELLLKHPELAPTNAPTTRIVKP